jgi:hypothetical protein
MRHRRIFNTGAAALLAAACFSLHAADIKADEAAIRKQIQALDTRTPGSSPGIILPDQVFWSGAYKRPIVRPQRPEPHTGRPGAIENRVPESMKSKTEPIRIVISESGDLAYEYSKSTLEFDMKTGGHMVLETGTLRVWQKRDGEWKSAAHFNFPYDRE